MASPNAIDAWAWSKPERAVPRAEPSQLAGRPGYCAVTGDERDQGCSAERRLGKVGGWFKGAFARLGSCLQLCAECRPCKYVSYSRRMNDCSWFATCRLDRLSTANSQHHKTFMVRHPNGTIVGAAGARLAAHARRNAARASNGSAAYVADPTRRVFFHEENAAMLYLHSTHPDFRSERAFGLLGGRASALPHDSRPVDTLREWQASIRSSPLSAGASSRRQHGTCAVVGSSAALLRRRHGARIDAHDAVYRVNEAPVERFGRHVGRRTTVRVWGAQKMPDLNSRWTAVNYTIAIYCGPTQWLGDCWTWIPVTGRPRFSPLAWREASFAVHGAAHDRLTGIYPSSGLMAIWLALAQCGSLTLYGFGWCDARAANASGLAENAVYYDPHDLRGKAGFGAFHRMDAEWAWLRRLQAQGVLKRAC